MEGRILEIENILKNAVIAKGSSSGRVQVGSKVTLESDGQELQYSLVGSHEGDPAQGLLSCDSPIGQAILDKKAGDKVQVETPRGFSDYRIKSVE